MRKQTECFLLQCFQCLNIEVCVYKKRKEKEKKGKEKTKSRQSESTRLEITNKSNMFTIIINTIINYYY